MKTPKTIDIIIGSRNEALALQSFLFGFGMAVSVRRTGTKSYAWNADELSVGYEVSFFEVA